MRKNNSEAEFQKELKVEARESANEAHGFAKIFATDLIQYGIGRNGKGVICLSCQANGDDIDPIEHDEDCVIGQAEKYLSEGS